jgi:murein DD-endopeptidase MepM/ murein hydrolase activator NlpD
MRGSVAVASLVVLAGAVVIGVAGPARAAEDLAAAAGRDVLVAQRGGKPRDERQPQEPSDSPPAVEPPRLTTLEASAVGVDGRVTVDALDAATKCGISRGLNCDIELAIERGLFETGLRPRFPAAASCHDIDEGWAVSYTSKRERVQYHGGIDMPAPFGTPMIAAAAGTVVAKSAEERSYRGVEIILRHSPGDTGLPVWTYTQYAHFDQMPSLRIGERVRMGQELGPTGNSGFQMQRGSRQRPRRPAIHFAVWFSTSPEWALVRNVVVPVGGWWMDPLALYRKKAPFDSASLKALPDGEKQVPIPVIFEDGKAEPADTKLIWPYKCGRN